MCVSRGAACKQTGAFMSKISLAIFLAAVALIVLAVALEMPFVGGGGGMLLLVGIIYAYVVTKRDAEGRVTED